ncbi:MAG: hypothetical protein ACTSPP_05040 [Candidatus Heimdallarchaeaceae archaeon]
MKIGVTKFPGTNNEQDVLRALSSFGVEGVLIYEKDADKLKDLNAKTRSYCSKNSNNAGIA